MSNQASSSTLLVTGASGQLGRRVVELLLEAGESNIVATTRTPEKLADFAARGVTIRHANFDDPSTLAEAFSGVDRLLLISTDSLDAPGHRVAQHRAAIKAAESAGVKHVLYTSIVKPNPDSPITVAHDHYQTETALAESSLGWTFLRNNIYAEMLIMSLSQALQNGGKLINAIGEGKISYVTREDCAQVAAAALRADFAGKRALEVTGPAAISQAELASIASQVLGKEISYVPVPLEALIQGMVSAGLPEAVAKIYASFDEGASIGLSADVSTTVQDLTGRQPVSVADFLAAHTAAFA